METRLNVHEHDDDNDDDVDDDDDDECFWKISREISRFITI